MQDNYVKNKNYECIIDLLFKSETGWIDSWEEEFANNPSIKYFQKILHPKMIADPRFIKAVSNNGQKYTTKTGKNVRININFQDSKINSKIIFIAEIVIYTNNDHDKGSVYDFEFDIMDLDKQPEFDQNFI